MQRILKWLLILFAVALAGFLLFAPAIALFAKTKKNELHTSAVSKRVACLFIAKNEWRYGG